MFNVSFFFRGLTCRTTVCLSACVSSRLFRFYRISTQVHPQIHAIYIYIYICMVYIDYDRSNMISLRVLSCLILFCFYILFFFLTVFSVFYCISLYFTLFNFMSLFFTLIFFTFFHCCISLLYFLILVPLFSLHVVCCVVFSAITLSTWSCLRHPVNHSPCTWSPSTNATPVSRKSQAPGTAWYIPVCLRCCCCR